MCVCIYYIYILIGLQSELNPLLIYWLVNRDSYILLQSPYSSVSFLERTLLLERKSQNLIIFVQGKHDIQKKHVILSYCILCFSNKMGVGTCWGANCCWNPTFLSGLYWIRSWERPSTCDLYISLRFLSGNLLWFLGQWNVIKPPETCFWDFGGISVISWLLKWAMWNELWDDKLVGGLNPSENIRQIGKSSPNRGENTKHLKPPPSKAQNP